MSEEEARAELVASAERNERELQRALDDLKDAVRQPFGFGLVERIAEQPLPWIASGLLLGIWLGSRQR